MGSNAPFVDGLAKTKRVWVPMFATARAIRKMSLFHRVMLLSSLSINTPNKEKHGI